ncbi:hypothetical protein [Chitinimonas sp.]|uniref:hypothetical protein n=1 Tax=Chitinimonas sp. TaxID=1934313 RepID=UPI002F95F689
MPSPTLILAIPLVASVLFATQARAADRTALNKALGQFASQPPLDRSTLVLNATGTGSIATAPQLDDGFCRAQRYRIASSTSITPDGTLAWPHSDGRCKTSDAAVAFAADAPRWLVRYALQHRVALAADARRLIRGHACNWGLSKNWDPIVLDSAHLQTGKEGPELVGVFRTTAYQGRAASYPDFRVTVGFRQFGKDYLPWSVTCPARH